MATIFPILKDKRAWKRFCRTNAIHLEPEPDHYPCVVDERLGCDQEPYLRYYALRDIEKLRNKLIKMGGGVKSRPS